MGGGGPGLSGEKEADRGMPYGDLAVSRSYAYGTGGPDLHRIRGGLRVAEIPGCGGGCEEVQRGGCRRRTVLGAFWRPL